MDYLLQIWPGLGKLALLVLVMFVVYRYMPENAKKLNFRRNPSAPVPPGRLKLGSFERKLFVACYHDNALKDRLLTYELQQGARSREAAAERALIKLERDRG